MRLPLASLPTPLEHAPRLSARLGLELWIKRDDATGGAEAGNKIRKLELLLAEARDRGATALITCGGIQSNHARATAIAAARLGLGCHLLLRLPGLAADRAAASEALAPSVGNVLLDRLVGAELTLISPASYARRDALMAELAQRLEAEGERPYVIPEGGSNGLGALGYVHAMQEIHQQLERGEAGGRPFDVIVHACGSGGTAAGCALGAAHFGVASEVCAVAVCDDAPTFTARIAAIIEEARARRADLPASPAYRVDDRFKGPAYAVSTPEQREVMVEAARLAGLVLDPVYTGKAMHAVFGMDALRGKRVLFLHTGGLPGLMAQAGELAPEL